MAALIAHCVGYDSVYFAVRAEPFLILQEHIQKRGKSQQKTEVELAAAARKKGETKEIVSQGQGVSYQSAGSGFSECPSCGYVRDQGSCASHATQS